MDEVRSGSLLADGGGKVSDRGRWRNHAQSHEGGTIDLSENEPGMVDNDDLRRITVTGGEGITNVRRGDGLAGSYDAERRAAGCEVVGRARERDMFC